MSDLRNALRTLTQSPAFVTVAVLTLALGIGANAMMFGIVDSLVLRPFPYPEPNRLVSVGVNFPRLLDEERFVEVLSGPEYEDIRGSRSFEKTLAFDLGNRHISGGDRPERVFTALVLGDPFETIGMRPIAGRGFLPDELRPGGRPVAILSHRFWQSRFGGDLSLVGRSVRVNGNEATVVGIMPPGLLLLGTDLWLPVRQDLSTWPRGRRQLTVLARLRHDTTLAQAKAELKVLADRTAREFVSTHSEYQGWTLAALPWADALSRDLRPAAMLLLGTVAAVLLIACVNLTNLLLIRATARRREIALRLTLGAGRWRIAREVLAETLLLGIAGAIAALWLARFGLDGVMSLLPAEILAMGVEPRISLRVVGYSAIAAGATGLLMALLPALQASSQNPEAALRGEGRTATPERRSHRLRFGLIVAEVALATVLLVGASLLLRSWSRLHSVDPGIRTQGVLTMRLTLPREKYRDEMIPPFFLQLIDRVRQIPEVEDAAVGSQFPPMSSFASPVRVDGQDASPEGEVRTALFTIVSPEYFSVLSIPIRAGRTFTEADRADTPRVAVVNETFARRRLGSAASVGRRVQLGNQWLEIVGVAADARSSGLTTPVRPEIYLSLAQPQGGWNQFYLLVRGRTDAADAVLPAVRSAVATIDPDQPVYAVQTLETVFATSTIRQRVSAWLLAGFAGLALLLAAIGVYGVMAFAVSSRTREIGVRVALGADARRVLSAVVAQAGAVIGVGLLLGLAAALALERVISGLLFDVSARDPIAFAIAAAAIGVTGLIAAFGPARRASRVDPMVALRYE